MKTIVTVLATALIVGGAFVWLDGDTGNDEVAAFGDNLIQLVNEHSSGASGANPEHRDDARSYTTQVVLPAASPNVSGPVGVGRVAIQAESFCREGYVCTGADHVAALSGVGASLLNGAAPLTEALADNGANDEAEDEAEDVKLKQLSAVSTSDGTVASN